MIGALCGNEPPAELVESLYYETEGNPFFLEELLKHLIEEDQLFDADGKFRTAFRPGDFAGPANRWVSGRAPPRPAFASHP